MREDAWIVENMSDSRYFMFFLTQQITYYLCPRNELILLLGPLYLVRALREITVLLPEPFLLWGCCPNIFGCLYLWGAEDPYFVSVQRWTLLKYVVWGIFLLSTFPPHGTLWGAHNGYLSSHCTIYCSVSDSYQPALFLVQSQWSLDNSSRGPVEEPDCFIVVQHLLS
jgi:hypothetical protein